ncbi:beta-ketoacyl synthase chain length factor [Cytophagaceae bacterium ABcell3]|nr:beta-ketoacyl synthase chain length factor [Cytophagaceae bacterium ABcell3]
MKVYITGVSAISPQHTFDEDNYLSEFVAPKDYFQVLEPSYNDFIPPMQARRMSKVVKMSIATAKKSLVSAGVEQPEAIIVGTGLGCLNDTEKFLNNIIDHGETLLSPTSFIQSTHNTIAGQVALLLTCPSYNFTYSQRIHSFENALQDAVMQLEEGCSNVLVGGADELIPGVANILTQIGCFSKASSKEKFLPVPGEGAAFFVLSKHKTPSAFACIDGVKTAYGRKSKPEVQEEILEFLKNNNSSIQDVDVVMLGYNGNTKEDETYHKLVADLFSDKAIIHYKNLCGEYFTAPSFGYHLAAKMLQRQEVFKETLVKGSSPKKLNKVLFYNVYKDKYHSLGLISKC